MDAPILPSIPVIKSVTDLRYKAREIMAHVQEGGNTVLLTRDNDPVAILFPIHLYESIRHYIEVMEDARDTETMRKALARHEPTEDFVAFDAKTRKKHSAPAYVSRRSKK